MRFVGIRFGGEGCVRVGLALVGLGSVRIRYYRFYGKPSSGVF